MNPLVVNMLLAVSWAALAGSFTLPSLALGFGLGYLALWAARPLFGDSTYFERVFRVLRLAAHLARSQLIEPNRLHDPKHPTVEPGARLPLVQSGERPFAGGLDQVVAVVDRPRQGEAEAAQSRQECDDLLLYVLRHGGSSACCPTVRQRFSPVVIPSARLTES